MTMKRIRVESLRAYYGSLWINGYSSEGLMIHVKLKKNSPYYRKCRDLLERFIEIPTEEIEAIAKGHCGIKEKRRVSPPGFLKKFIK